MSLATFLERHADLESAAATGCLRLDWATLARFDRDLAAQVSTDPLAVADTLTDALVACDVAGLEPDALDIHVDGVVRGQAMVNGGDRA